MGIGRMRVFFQRSGIWAREIERLKVWVRYCMPAGPRCFKCKIVSPSGPVAVEFLHWWMTVAVWLAVNGVKERSSMCSRFTWRRVRRRSGSREWTTVPVNCLEKWRAMAVGLEQTLVLPPREKEIGWLGEALGLLPERLRIVDQNLLALGLVRDGGDEGPPSRTGGGFSEGVNLRVEDADSRIGRVQGPAGIALIDEPLNFRAGGWAEILPEPGRNGAFGCLEKDPIEIIDG